MEIINYEFGYNFSTCDRARQRESAGYEITDEQRVNAGGQAPRYRLRKGARVRVTDAVKKHIALLVHRRWKEASNFVNAGRVRDPAGRLDLSGSHMRRRLVHEPQLRGRKDRYDHADNDVHPSRCGLSGETEDPWRDQHP